ncbi:MAG: MarR family transcriptional regulator [Gemmatimonadota bacterium]
MKRVDAAASTAAVKETDTAQLVYALMHAGRALEDRLDVALGRAGLSLAKFGVLSELVRSPEPLTLSELAARLSCVRSNMTQLIDRLESDGLVRRVDDPADRRTVRASLTPLGRSQQAAGDQELRSVQHEIGTQLGQTDCTLLNRALETLG